MNFIFKVLFCVGEFLDDSNMDDFEEYKKLDKTG